MLKEFARSIFNKLPTTFRNNIKSFRNRKIRAGSIAKWERNGRPVPPPHQVKQMVVEQYRNSSGFTTFVETGTSLGDMVDAEKNQFTRIYSVELGEKLWKDAVKRFRRYKHIKIIQGDSAKVLADITAQLDQPVIFWLDAHYSAGLSAKGDKDCPIFDELNAIFKKPGLNHILLIDDARFFNGQGDYPTIPHLTDYVKSKDNRYSVEVKDDIIRFTISQ